MTTTKKSNLDQFSVQVGEKVVLKDCDPAQTDFYPERQTAKDQLKKNIKQIAEYQNILYAQDTHSVLIILQGMDTAGKDSLIKHVLSGVNPQGTQVHSFKEPSAEEQDHDFLWRHSKVLPPRGSIGIFNRSYYEEVLVARVHPEILESERLPKSLKDKNIWKNRFEDINNFEKYLMRNGVVVLKFFLHLSKKEQKNRLLSRIEESKKNWKFSLQDVNKRVHWDHYLNAYESAINHTSTSVAPWYIIPADHKWYSRIVISDIIVKKLESLHLSYPQVNPDQLAELAEGKRLLEAE